jgi:hypothetical protein
VRRRLVVVIAAAADERSSAQPAEQQSACLNDSAALNRSAKTPLLHSIHGIPPCNVFFDYECNGFSTTVDITIANDPAVRCPGVSNCR